CDVARNAWEEDFSKTIVGVEMTLVRRADVIVKVTRDGDTAGLSGLVRAPNACECLLRGMDTVLQRGAASLVDLVTLSAEPGLGAVLRAQRSRSAGIQNHQPNVDRERVA